MRDPRNIAVIGVTGYTGFELATLLLRHPAIAKPTFYVRETHGFQCLSQLFPQLRARGEAPLRPLSIDAITSSAAGTAFLATPHEVSAEIAPKLLDAGLRVIDLSGAFRFASRRNIHVVVQAPRATRRAAVGSRLWPAGVVCGPHFCGKTGRQSRMLCHQRDPCAAASDGCGLGRARRNR